jgi:hypothetical protein
MFYNKAVLIRSLTASSVLNFFFSHFPPLDFHAHYPSTRIDPTSPWTAHRPFAA